MQKMLAKMDFKTKFNELDKYSKRNFSKKNDCIVKERIINKTKKCRTEMKELNLKIQKRVKENQDIFERYAQTELILKNYIIDLNKKFINVDEKTDQASNISKIYKNILKSINEIQDQIIYQIKFVKEEMNNQISKKFKEAEEEQREIIHKKMDEQKKVFERMINTREKLEKVKKHFDKVNNTCEILVKNNFELKLNYETSKDTNNFLENKLIKLQKEYKKLIDKYSKKNNDSIIQVHKKMDTSISNNTQQKYLTHRIYSDNDESEGFMKDRIINKIKKTYESEKLSIKNLYNDYSLKLKEKSDLQYLIQKCIEDLTLEINELKKKENIFIEKYTNRQIKKNIKTQYDNFIYSFYIKSEINYDIDNIPDKEKNKIIEIHSQVEILYKKLKILAYIYDNSFINNK